MAHCRREAPIGTRPRARSTPQVLRGRRSNLYVACALANRLSSNVKVVRMVSAFAEGTIYCRSRRILGRPVAAEAAMRAIWAIAATFGRTVAIEDRPTSKSADSVILRKISENAPRRRAPTGKKRNDQDRHCRRNRARVRGGTGRGAGEDGQDRLHQHVQRSARCHRQRHAQFLRAWARSPRPQARRPPGRSHL